MGLNVWINQKSFLIRWIRYNLLNIIIKIYCLITSVFWTLNLKYNGYDEVIFKSQNTYSNTGTLKIIPLISQIIGYISQSV